MKSKTTKILFITYKEDNTKSPIMVFDNSLSDDNIKDLIFDYFKTDADLVERYDDSDLKDAAEIIVNGSDSWDNVTEEYYLDSVILYYM